LKQTLLHLLTSVVLLAYNGATPALAEEELGQLQNYGAEQGFFDFWWDAENGRLLLRIAELEQPFLYQNALARGIGSNDLGLDRGQLGATRLVRFLRSGAKILLVQDNHYFRALNGDIGAQEALQESFARSVIWGFKVLGEDGGDAIVDATEFLLRDAHGIAAWLEQARAGKYTTDATRSAIYRPRTRAFPDNSEFEAIVTLTGKPEGELLDTVVPDPTAITVHMHHSFIRLPDPGYSALPFDSRGGLIGLAYDDPGFLDYSSDIGATLNIAYGRRHRLHKRDPGAAISEPVEPIVYYVDRGAPEPVRSALIEGASWWNQAFTAAGYKDAFRVELLPEGADPMDVRYNVIQWVHRSTRGWSYGSSVMDPRTGEILKGHVTLGSLRVHQDYLIAEGLLAPYGNGEPTQAMLDMSLARIRQLSAHEVGHTIGLEHNFAGSTQNRSSVMDYPFPLIRFDEKGGMDLSDAYGTGIGEWDKRVILYAYQDFPEGTDENQARAKILADTIASGLKFVADQDSRNVGAAHPDGNLWDNGSDAIAELEHLLRVREYALERFSQHVIPPGQAVASLEDVLVPVYLLHRYQVQAVGKLLGGQRFSYAMRGDGQSLPQPVSAAEQRRAMQALVSTLDPALLRLPDDIVAQIPPRPPGNPRTRESFHAYSGVVFDPLAPARSASSLTLDVLLHPARAARMNYQHAAAEEFPGFEELCESILQASWYQKQRTGVEAQIQRVNNESVLQQLTSLSANVAAAPQVRDAAGARLHELQRWLERRARREKQPDWRAHYVANHARLAQYLANPASVTPIPPTVVPPGSPIGSSPAGFSTQ
jgi:hypothetical protein